VLGLPRGGVPVAARVAAVLGAPLDVLVVRKVGVPGNDELAMGAVGPGGVIVLDQRLIAALALNPAEVTGAVARQRHELERREAAYREGRPPPDLTGLTVFLVDDGLATGATMAAAVAAVGAQRAGRVVVAVPVAPASTVAGLSAAAGVDDVVCILTPEPFRAVGLWYRRFEATRDEEVRRLLAEAEAAPGGPLSGRS
jgi:predicted phosphoribosyltransferase